MPKVFIVAMPALAQTLSEQCQTCQRQASPEPRDNRLRSGQVPSQLKPMQAQPPREPTLGDILTELQSVKSDLQSFKSDVDQRFEQVDKRFEQVDKRFEQVDQRLERLDYKFDTYEKASEKLSRLATTIIVAAATVAVLPAALQAFGPLITQIVLSGQ